jgi:catechol 2,3-dioxygenase-like lactoylglutathione lyase family enzyme
MDQDKTGGLSRRRMLGTLGAAAGSAAFAGPAFAQGGCRDGYGQAATSRCPLPMDQATAPIKEVFDSTGWKTSALESFTVDVVDYKKEAAFYIALMGWKLRSDDGKQAILDVGNWGNAILRGAPADSFGPGRPAANGGPAQPPPRAAVRSFAWVIDKWDARTVAAALSQRGMTPVADNKGAFESFRVKDPDGWDLQICNNKGLSAARKKPATGILSEAPPFGPTGWKTVWLDHFSFRVSNYKQSASYYANLLGWQRTYDEGTQNELMVGDIGEVLCRGGNPFIPAQANGPKGAVIDHISFGITPWDVEAVRSALESRGLHAQIDTSGAHIGPDNKITQDDIYQAAFQSYHTDTPNGFNLQISWNTLDKRLALANAVKPKALRKYPTPVQQPMGSAPGGT